MSKTAIVAGLMFVALASHGASAIGTDALRIVVMGTSQPAPCDYFSPHGDGAWSNRMPITIIVTADPPSSLTKGVIMKKGFYNLSGPVEFKPGVPINGVDLTGQLESECGKK